MMTDMMESIENAEERISSIDGKLDFEESYRIALISLLEQISGSLQTIATELIDR